MYDVFNIDMWKFKIGAYLRALGLHIFLATTKKSYLGNDKYLEANHKPWRYLGTHKQYQAYMYDMNNMKQCKV